MPKITEAPLSPDDYVYLSELWTLCQRRRGFTQAQAVAFCKERSLPLSDTNLQRIAGKTYTANPSPGVIFALCILAMEPYQAAFDMLGRKVPETVSTYGTAPPPEDYVETDPWLIQNPLPPYRRLDTDQQEYTKSQREHNMRMNAPLVVYVNMALPKYNYNVSDYVHALRKMGAKMGTTMGHQICAGSYPGSPSDSVLAAIAMAADVEPAIVFGALNRDAPAGIHIANFPRDFASLSVDDRAMMVRLFDKIILATNREKNTQ